MFRKITLFALVLALLTITFATSMRYSNAVLGCPDWPTCYGQALVSSNADFLEQAKALYPTAFINIVKAKKVMVYRYAAGFLGISILVLALSLLFQKRYRLAAISSSIFLLLLLGLQIAFDLWSLSMKGMPIIVIANLIISLMIFWFLFWVYQRFQDNLEIVSQNSLGPKILTRFAMFILLLQIILGALVSTNSAAQACVGFPKCNGFWMPAVDYIRALNIFYGLNNGYSGILSNDGQIAVNWMHRVGMLVTFIMLTWVMLRATSGLCAKRVRKSGIYLSILLLAEIVIGILGSKFKMPFLISISHTLFSALLMLPLIAISFYSKYAYTDDALVVDEVEDFEYVVEDEVDTEFIEPIDIEDEAFEESYVEPSAESLYLRLKTQLQKTRTGFGSVLSGLSLTQKEIDEDLLEHIESSLLMADIGVDATSEIISRLTESLEKKQLNDVVALEAALKQLLLEMLQPCCKPLQIPQQDGPFVILVVGINGVGKTTTIGKLAKRLQGQGHSVMLAAGDTFRAAAVEQLQVWGERNNIHVVAQHTGADSASVLYDGVQSAQAKGIDVLIADTAGRLHTKSNLMDELSKIKRIIGKVDETAPHEVLLVLDAGTGQNALSQTKIFNEVVELTGLALTKLDGTAKGGVIFALAKQFGLPIRFIGVGEGIDDLQDFDAQSFVDALFVNES